MTGEDGYPCAVAGPPPFDAELLPALRTISAALPPDAVTFEYIPTLRGGSPAILVPDDVELERAGRFDVRRDVAIGADGAQIPLLVCRPRSGPVNATVGYLHGGGMVAGDSRNGIQEALDWADELGLAVVSVDYRLAPEHPYPTPFEDCYAALAWIVAHSEQLGCASRRVVLAGASAGGGLAAGVALAARDRGGPPICGLVLMAPMLDDRNNSFSARQMEGHGVWDRHSNATGWRALLGEACGGADVPPYAAPARATSLADLPPTFVDAGSAETFRDEAVAFAQRLWADGGSAELHVWPGGFHGFTAYAPHAAVSKLALRSRVDWLSRLLGG